MSVHAAVLSSLLLLGLGWSQAVQAQWRPLPGPPPGGFGPQPTPVGPPTGRPGGPRPGVDGIATPCPIEGGSGGLVDDLRSTPGVGGGAAAAPETTQPPPSKEVPYFYQYANRLNPGASCQNTSIAMLLNYYGLEVTPDQITSRFGKDKAQSPEGLAQVFNTYASEAGIAQRLQSHRDGTMSDVNQQLQSGTPTIVHGYFTAGHVVLATGYDGSSYTVNDPAGRWNQTFEGGYTGSQSSTSGQGVTYGAGAFESAIATSNGSAHLPVWWHEVYTTP